MGAIKRSGIQTKQCISTPRGVGPDWANLWIFRMFLSYFHSFFSRLGPVLHLVPQQLTEKLDFFSDVDISSGISIKKLQSRPLWNIPFSRSPNIPIFANVNPVTILCRNESWKGDLGQNDTISTGARTHSNLCLFRSGIYNV